MSTRKSHRFVAKNAEHEMSGVENTPNNVITRSGRKVKPTKNKSDLYMENTPTKRTPSKKQSKESSTNQRSNQDDMSCSEDEIVNDENRFEPLPGAALLHNESEMAGNQMFGFHTPKKRNAMMAKAENTPKTPLSDMKSLSLNTPKTPKTPKSRIDALRTQQNAHTPSEIRAKNKKQLQRKVQEAETESSADEHSDYEPENEQSSESSEEESSESESDSEEEAKTKKNTRKIPQIKISMKSGKYTATQVPTRASARVRTRAQKVEDFIPDSDNYFITASNKKSKTSDHTLDRLKSSRLQHEELFSLLSTIHSSEEHEHRIAEMFDELKLNFNRWMLEMSKGYNIIVYGNGSKQQLLHSFCEEHVADKPLVVVNGFFPSLTVKDILQAIKVQLLEISTTSRNDHEVVDLIASTLDGMPNRHVFLVINNIDGVMLRKTKDQHIISRLAKIKNLHLIASIDHINAPLMWDQTCMDNFNFVWYDCTTMLPYKNETAFENSVFFQNSGELDLAAMSNVFRSLTTNARGIYMILVKNLIANHKDSNYQGMTFKDLYHKCRESFLVSSDSTLRTQLIEFVDHNMAKIKRSHDGTEQVSIPINIQILSLFTQQQND